MSLNQFKRNEANGVHFLVFLPGWNSLNIILSRNSTIDLLSGALSKLLVDLHARISRSTKSEFTKFARI
jgi:hypothetical protein